MIQFDEIDARLSALGKDRAWLAEVTPYSADYIRTVLAPASTRRTERVQTVLSDAIEREEVRQSARADLPERVSLELSREELEAWNRAASASNQVIYDWAVDQLNIAADQYFKGKQSAAESPCSDGSHCPPVALPDPILEGKQLAG